jgi:hypothetical protein
LFNNFSFIKIEIFFMFLWNHGQDLVHAGVGWVPHTTASLRTHDDQDRPSNPVIFSIFLGLQSLLWWIVIIILKEKMLQPILSWVLCWYWVYLLWIRTLWQDCKGMFRTSSVSSKLIFIMGFIIWFSEFPKNLWGPLTFGLQQIFYIKRS